ncbi:SDR family oxidoreductase [Collinsella sp. AGMB00827]|uniref:SDR family oxidoreductase n=1 Tax=Collinsella ureilytica TaxID=2869515 RepID=A0ABS7MKF0_9ACTN|nr:SDR family oxidoreductase [Collinsella urealyticum]MBY4797560.1 SDR family oxidoreductase [Collinsella urealyticum]
MQFKDKIVLLTGASSGVGFEAALLFAAEGAKVYAVARRVERLQKLVEKSKSEGYPGEIILAAGDVGKKEDVEKVIATIESQEGKLDVLACNAGVMDKFEPITNLSEESFDWIMNVNVKGNARLFKYAIPLMKDGGSIVVTSSIAGIRGGKAGAAYTMSKHALNGLVKNTAAMYGNKNIRCNAVAPGGIATEMVTSLTAPDAGIDTEGMEVIGRGANINKMSASAKEIAENLVFLASDHASNINGLILVSDGGLTNM